MEINEARVWSRVRGETSAEDLPELITEEWMDAATYLSLSRKLTGADSARLYALFQEEQAHAACLKGIYTLTTGRRPKVRMGHPPLEPIEQTLRRCYGREMRSLTVYEARTSDAEFGHVFARMALQEREHCRILLEILGNLTRSGV